jgi:outer membrane protein TolC
MRRPSIEKLRESCVTEGIGAAAPLGEVHTAEAAAGEWKADPVVTPETGSTRSPRVDSKSDFVTLPKSYQTAYNGGIIDISVCNNSNPFFETQRFARSTVMIDSKCGYRKGFFYPEKLRSGCTYQRRSTITPMTRQRHLNTFAIAVCAGLALSVGLNGCSRYRAETVEEMVQRTLAKGDTQIVGSKLAADSLSPPTYPAAVRAANTPPAALETVPETVNPAASELQYSPADEARDVAAKLREYAALEGVILGLNDEGTEDAEFGTFGDSSQASSGELTTGGGESAQGGSGDASASSTPSTVQTPTLPNVRKLTLTDAFAVAQETGREYLSAEEDYILAAIRLLLERHLWGPRLFNDTTVGMVGQGTDGSFQSTLNVINELRATQRLPYGGNVEAAWIVNATDQLREQTSGGYQQASRIVLSGSIPLLRGAGDVAREDLIQAERNLIYQARAFERFRREFLVDIAGDYFDLLESKAAIANQQRQLKSLRGLERATIAKVNAGKLEASDKGIASNRVQDAQATLASLVDRYILQLERFKIRLGLSVDRAIAVSDDILRVPEPNITMAQAAQLALEYRLDLQNQRDRTDDARRRVSNARNGLLPDLRLNGDVNIPTDPRDATGGIDPSPDDLNYGIGATLSIPLDREQERLTLRAAMIESARASRTLEQARDNVVVDVRVAMRAVDNARLQLTIAQRRVEINRDRLRGQILKIDLVDTQTIVDSENELLQSENSRDRAQTALRNQILLYLLATDQLRVARDGTFAPLPGM